MTVDEREIREVTNALFGLIDKLGLIEKTPRRYGTEELFYTSELTTLETIGYSPGLNVTELAEQLGITKGGVSQMIKKLEQKGLVTRYHDEFNKKEVFHKLSMKGEIIFHQHQLFHLKHQADFMAEMATWTPEQMQFIKRVLAMFQRLVEGILKEVKIE